MLLAGRRLMADPWNGSRTQAALLATVVAGAIAIGYRQFMITEFASYAGINALTGDGESGMGPPEDTGFYLGAVRLVLIAIAIGMTVAAAGVLIALAESIVARRRSYAALTAVGVPRRVLSESVAWHTFTPLVPALLVGVAAGATIVRSIGTEVTQSTGESVCRATPDLCAAHPETYTDYVVTDQVVLAVPVPWAGLALLLGFALVVTLLAVGAGLVVLRSSTDLEELRAG
jgi:FtsX-like permease family protein